MNNSSQSPHGLRFGIFEIDLDARELRKNGIRVKLQEQPFKILAVIVCRAGEVITREELYAELSSHSTYDSKHGLNNAIQKIREALGDSPDNARFIETVPGRGYRFLPQVEVIYRPSVRESNWIQARETDRSGSATVERSTAFKPPTFSVAERMHRSAAVGEAGSASATPVSNSGLKTPADRSRTPKRWSLWFGAIASLIVVALLSVIYLRWNVKPNEKAMLVVVPFLNISGDSSQEYIADGMTEEMITQLSRLNPTRLGVIARTTSMQYKGTHKDAAQIGRELRVNYLLEGSVRHEGNRVRVTAQLIQTSDQTHIWAESYDVESGDVLKMQSAIARSIGGETQIALSKQVREQLDSAAQVNTQAHLVYLRGLQSFSRRTREGQLAAIGQFKESVAIDPGYAPASTALAHVYTLAPIFGAETPVEAFSHAAAAATHALSLDDTLAEAHSYLGFTKAHADFDWPNAEREFRKALELDSNSPIAHLYYAHSYLAPMGRRDEAIAEIKKALELDPLSHTLQSFLGRFYMVAQRYDDALAQLKRSGEMDPASAINHERLAHLYANLGRFQDAIDEETRARVLSGEEVRLADGHERALTQAFESAGPRGYWLKELEFAGEEPNPPEAYVTSYGRAILYSKLGEKEKAIEYLNKAYDERDIYMTELAITADFDFMRSDPRFKILLERTGLGS